HPPWRRLRDLPPVDLRRGRPERVARRRFRGNSMSPPVVPSHRVRPTNPARSIRPPPANMKQQLAAMLVESSDDAIIGLTPKSVVTTWNRAAQRLYGYTAQEVVGRNISFLLPPDRLDEVDGVQIRAANRGGQEYETKRIHKDGHLIDVAIA